MDRLAVIEFLIDEIQKERKEKYPRLTMVKENLKKIRRLSVEIEKDLYIYDKGEFK